MLVLEIDDTKGTIYLSTTDRTEILEAIEFLAKKYPKIETRDQKQVTLLDFREGKKEDKKK